MMRARSLPSDADEAADDLLARALRGDDAWDPACEPDRVVARAHYHGTCGLLPGRLGTWPDRAAEPIRQAALAQAMWEMRHRRVLADLLRAMEAAGVEVLVLKGTSLAYDVYDTPAARRRGDSDLLIRTRDLGAARTILEAQGFEHHDDPLLTDEAVRHQEMWARRTPDGLLHEIDLHWQAFNSAALGHLIPFDDAWARARALPGLAPGARGLSRDLALLLACAHRAQHIVNPYFVDDEVHYGGDRLIWLLDIDLLARAMTGAEWTGLVEAATAGGLAPVAAEALETARRRLGTPLPAAATARLGAAPPDTPEARYLLSSGAAARAWRDLRAASGLRAGLAYLRGRLLPSASFMRAKYPQAAHRPLAFLYVLRVAEFLKPRPGGRAR